MAETERTNEGRSGERAATGTLGTFAGVFTPSILTILGIILFLRLGYVVGSAGLGRTLVIIGLANVITVLTSLSLSAIATNIRVKGGGDYFLISRTLGREFGGAIGIVLFLAQTISIAFYAIGFGEALTSILGAQVPHLPQILAFGAVVVLFVLAWLGADWATRFQFGIMAILFAALVVFFAGGVRAWNPETLETAWRPSGNVAFWASFALFFPAVTGFTQGVSLSGDLKDPGRSLPMGTFLAVWLSFLVYIAVAFVFAAVVPRSTLVSDYQAMQGVSIVPWLIDAGVIAATLSSALASFLGAPRILQSLASDRMFPLLNAFSQGTGVTNNPRRGVLLAGAIALAVVAAGNLNVIAPIVAMFFLISYGLLNYATYSEARANSPSFRPRFRFYGKYWSLAGCLACAGAIVAINPTAGAIAFALLIAIHQYLARTAKHERWADSSYSSRFQRVRDNLIAMSAELVHPRDWRPVVLAFSQSRERRGRLLRFATWIEGGSGITTAIEVVEGEGLQVRRQAKELETELRGEIRALGSHAFAEVVASDEPAEAFSELIQAHGLGPIRANLVLLNWYDQQRVAVDSPGLRAYGRHLRTALRFGRSVIVLSAPDRAIERLDATDERRRRIDIWWRNDATSRLSLLLGYLVTRHEQWDDSQLRVLAERDAEASEEDALEALREMLDDVRIEATPHVVEDVDAQRIASESADATLVFLPFRVRDDEPVDLFGDRLDPLLERLPITALVLAAGDIQLDSEPDESLHGEIAAALDAAAKSDKLALAAEKEAAAAVEHRDELANALEQTADLSDEDRAQLARDAQAATESAEQTRRRAAKTRAKAELATREADALTQTDGESTEPTPESDDDQA